jgi:hypothetical protein
VNQSYSASFSSLSPALFRSRFHAALTMGFGLHSIPVD